MNTITRDDTLRVSDADRDLAISELSEHFQAGRLTTEELEERTGQALRARTARDLAGLFTDLPRPQPALTARAPVPTPDSTVPVRVLPVAILVVVVLSGLLGGHPGLIALVPVIVVVLVARRRPARRRDVH